MGLIAAARRLVAGDTGRPRAEITDPVALERAMIAQESPLSAAGVAVTAERALMVQAVSMAVGRIAESIAQLPLVLYRRTAGGKERAEDHPLWPLLHERPNAFQNAFEFKEMLAYHLLLWGNAYAFVIRTRMGRGDVAELLPIHPDRADPRQDADWTVTYDVALPDGRRRTWDAGSVLHVRDRTLDGVKGLSRLKTGRDTIGLSRVAERWGAQLFGNGARPSGVLTTPERVKNEDRQTIAESWRAAHGGENALGTAVLDGGWSFTPLAMSNTDAQFLETRKFQVAEVARLYGLPSHAVNDLERATFSNIEQQSVDFVRYGLLPWLRRIEMAVTTQVIRPQDPDLFCEFLVDGLLRGTTKERYEAHAIGLQNGFLSINEVRAVENRNPVPGGDTPRPARNLFGDDDGKRDGHGGGRRRAR